MPADGVQAAAWGGISARPAGSTDEITSVLAAQKEGENGSRASMAPSILRRPNGLPLFVPCLRALASPAITRSRIKLRSNSAKTPSISNMALPAGVVVSSPESVGTAGFSRQRPKGRRAARGLSCSLEQRARSARCEACGQCRGPSELYRAVLSRAGQGQGQAGRLRCAMQGRGAA
jgi:hypothetical protein